MSWLFDKYQKIWEDKVLFDTEDAEDMTVQEYAEIAEAKAYFEAIDDEMAEDCQEKLECYES